jgi:hypothetical protein
VDGGEHRAGEEDVDDHDDRDRRVRPPGRRQRDQRQERRERRPSVGQALDPGSVSHGAGALRGAW